MNIPLPLFLTTSPINKITSYPVYRRCIPSHRLSPSSANSNNVHDSRMQSHDSKSRVLNEQHDIHDVGLDDFYYRPLEALEKPSKYCSNHRWLSPAIKLTKRILKGNIIQPLVRVACGSSVYTSDRALKTEGSRVVGLPVSVWAGMRNESINRDNSRLRASEMTAIRARLYLVHRCVRERQTPAMKFHARCTNTRRFKTRHASVICLLSNESRTHETRLESKRVN